MVPTKRTFIAGLSAGGAMAATVAQAYPDVFSACGVHSGLAPSSARGVLDALCVMRSGSAPWFAGQHHLKRIRTIVIHGDKDKTVNPRHALHVVSAALGGEPGSEIRDESLQIERSTGNSLGMRTYQRLIYRDATGRAMAERWDVKGLGHAWSGGNAGGSYVDKQGPDATAAMLAFFLESSI